MTSKPKSRFLDFNIDRHLNPYIPPNILHHLPSFLSHFLGHRHQGITQEPPAVIQWISMFIATVAGLSIVSSTYLYSPVLNRFHPPVILASLGASAVLDYNTIRSPLAQPRNAILGHALAAIVGVAVAKLFQLNPHFDEISWVAGAVGCACASLVMSATNTIHPPGGATALLASTDVAVRNLGWMLVPLTLIGSLLMLGVSLLLNNIARQYPMYWWTAEECGTKLKRKEKERKEDEGEPDVERAPSLSESELSDTTLHKIDSMTGTIHGSQDIRISAHGILIPSELALRPYEFQVLETLRQRLAKTMDTTDMNG